MSDRDPAIDLSMPQLTPHSLPSVAERGEEMRGSTTGFQQQSRAHAEIPY